MTAPTRTVGGKPASRQPATGSSGLTERRREISQSRAAAARAYARKVRRTKTTATQRTPPSAKSRNAPFAVMVIVVLALGISAIMWLSTQATADSYRLQDARAQVTELTRQVEHLEREVAFAESPVELANAAAKLGLAPVSDPARLRKLPNGDIEQFGEAKPAAVSVTPTASSAPAPTSAPGDTQTAEPAATQGGQHSDQPQPDSQPAATQGG